MTSTRHPPAIPDGAGVRDPYPSTMALKWSVLRHVAGVVATLAGVPRDADGDATAGYPATMHAAGGWRLALAAQGVDDLAAVMEPGVAALLSINSRGADPAAPAHALWEEFAAARAALLALAPPQR